MAEEVRRPRVSGAAAVRAATILQYPEEKKSKTNLPATKQRKALTQDLTRLMPNLNFNQADPFEVGPPASETPKTMNGAS